MIRLHLFCFFILLATACFSQNAALQAEFCSNLHKIMESGKMENFESLKTVLFKTVPIMDTHQPSLKLPQFPILIIDKDQRFIAKTNLNMDSLTAVKKLDELKPYVSFCLDSTWIWQERAGDDTSTIFLKEYRELYATDGMLTITLAMIGAADKIYSADMYIRRNNQRLRR